LTPSPPSEAGGTGPAGGRPDFPSPTKLVRNGLTGTELGAQKYTGTMRLAGCRQGLKLRSPLGGRSSDFTPTGIYLAESPGGPLPTSLPRVKSSGVKPGSRPRER